MLRTTMLVCLILSLAAVVSAQYAITDLINDDSSKPGTQLTSPTATPGAAPLFSNSVRSPLVAQPGSVANTNNAPTPVNRVNPLFGAGSTPSPMNAGNAMASMLSSMTGAAANPSMVSHGAKSTSGQVLSADSMAVVSGLVEAFMHKMKLLPGEKSCLENNVGQLTGDIMGTVGDIVTAIKDLIAGKGTVTKKATGGILSAGIDSAMKITSLVGLSTQLVQNCVHGDALILLQKTARLLVNGTYLQHQFIVNGVDIAHDLSDSIVAFEAHDFHRFGTDIGLSLRKLLLSTSTNATRLPEGVPEEAIIQQATDGLMKGFFVSGSSMEITDTVHPDIDVKVNLHHCIAGNSAFFKEVWMGAWDLIARLSVNAKQHGLGEAFQELGQTQRGGQPKWTGELMVAMMQFPMAMERCGISQDMQDTFYEAINTLNDVRVKFKFPDDNFAITDQNEVPDKMAKAVEAWTNWDFEGFGFQLGELFRELVMLAFPQKYSVDASGRLRRVGKKAGSISANMVIIGGAATTLLVAFAAVRTRRTVPRLLMDRAPVADIEDGETAESVE